jgi:hypothetical protein
MYVHISASPDKYLKQSITRIVSRYGTVITCMQKFSEQGRGQESVYLVVP